MDGSDSGSGKVFGRFTEQARRVLDLAREEAERCGHRYLGPEHLLLGVLAEGHSAAARVLRAHGVELAAARAEVRHLAERGVVPAPRPSDAELLGMLGIDLDTIRHHTEQTFGLRAVGEATWRVARRFWPSARCSWPASRRACSAMARSAPSTWCWGCWRPLASRWASQRRPGGTGGSPPTSGCRTATEARPGRCWGHLGSTWTSCGTPLQR